MPDSRQLANKLKSTPRMALRSKAMKNTPTSSSMMSIENNEELLNTIRGIIKEELEDHEKKMKQEYEEHEKKINDIIKSHLETTNKRLEEISKEVRDITESVEFTEGRLDEEIATVKDDISKMKSDVRLIERDLLDPNDVPEKLIELEDRSRRNNLRFDGLTEDTNETWEQFNCQYVFKHFFFLNKIPVKISFVCYKSLFFSFVRDVLPCINLASVNL